MCPRACPPQKTNIVEDGEVVELRQIARAIYRVSRYLDGFYLCGMTLVNVAKRHSVTPKAVENALKRYDKEAYIYERERRKRENGHKRRQKDRERKYTTAAREKDRERKRCEREEENIYVEAVRKALQDGEVVDLLRRAARELGLAWDQWACTRYIPEAPAIQHPCPGQAKGSVELITPGEASGRAEYEFHQIRGGMVGVPGPALLQIRPALDHSEIGLAYQLASEAVLRAGFVNPQARAGEVMKGLTRTYLPREMEALRVDLVLSARAMAKIPEPSPLAELNKREKEAVVRRWLAQVRAIERENMWSGTSGTGKLGKEGGIRNADKDMAMSARTRS